MPAAKSMANQDTLLYSGFSPSSPRRIFPYRLNASTSAKTTNRNMTPRYSQENRCLSIFISPSARTAKDWLSMMPQRAMTRAIAADKINTISFFLLSSFNSLPP